MENLSATAARMMPGIGIGPMGPPGPTPAAGGFEGLIPGFDVIQRLFLKLGLDPSFLVTLGMMLTLVTSLLSFFSYSFSSLTTLTRFISANLVSSATIHSSDVTYLYIMRWLATHKISTDCRLFCVTSRKNPQSYAVRRYSSYAPYGDGSRSCQEDDEEEEDGGSEDDSLGPRLKYTPAPGFLYFWHRDRPIIINRKLDLSYYTGDIPDETIVLTTIGRSPSFLRDILNEARRDYLQAQSRKTMVYTLSPTPFAQKTWDQGRHRPSRDISTVIMPPEEKKFLLQDVKEYLNPVTMRWYAQRGLPYRRGYLFYGPPGTGKTSLSLALAGELKLPLYILSLSTGSLTDETLTMLFVGLPRKCIVLLEDIDCAGVHRNGGHSDGWGDMDCSDDDDEDDDDDSSDDEKASGGKSKGDDKKSSSSSKKDNSNKSPSPQPRRPRISVSFSGLLNAIDGVASHEGRILIMTTNHRERLDSALIRPGRVDVQIEFGYAAKETLSEIFRELYKEIGCKISEGKSEKKEKKGPERENVNRLAEKFAEKIPANRFTPAEVQGFLMSYKGQPEKALENIDDWVLAKTKNEREKKARLERKKKISRKEAVEKRPVEVSNELNVDTPVNSISNAISRPSNGFAHHAGTNDAPELPQSFEKLSPKDMQAFIETMMSALSRTNPVKGGGQINRLGSNIGIPGSGDGNFTPSDSDPDDDRYCSHKATKKPMSGVNTFNGVNGHKAVSGSNGTNGHKFSNGVNGRTGVNGGKSPKKITNGTPTQR